MFVNALYKFAFKRNYFDDNNLKKHISDQGSVKAFFDQKINKKSAFALFVYIKLIISDSLSSDCFSKFCLKLSKLAFLFSTYSSIKHFFADSMPSSKFPSLMFDKELSSEQISSVESQLTNKWFQNCQITNVFTIYIEK